MIFKQLQLVNYNFYTDKKEYQIDASMLFIFGCFDDQLLINSEGAKSDSVVWVYDQNGSPFDLILSLNSIRITFDTTSGSILESREYYSANSCSQ